GFILFIILVSIFVSRHEKNSEDYFLVGRSLSWWLIGMSLIASNISTEHFVGMAGQGFREDIGMAVASFEWIGALALVIVALYLLPGLITYGIFTMAHDLGYWYDGATSTMTQV